MTCDVQSPTSIHQFVEYQAAQTPDAIAVIYRNHQLSYREINEKANQVAHYLKALGVKPETLVGVCLERSLDLVIALLGILKAGGAYVPLDASYPRERLGFILEDTQLSILITQNSLLQYLPMHQAQQINVNNDQKLIGQQSTENIEYEDLSKNLAYIIYTSGSTGRPKGVAIEHRNTVAFINWAKTFFALGELQGVLASTSICFDLSVFEIFVTLSSGGTVILAKDALELSALAAAEQVTLINTVPSAIEALLYMNSVPKSVCTINLAGEPLQNALVQKLYRLDHVKRIYNLYGPSEDTTYSTAAKMPKGSYEIPSIGYPIADTQIYLLTSQLEPVPDGVEGEIHIGGKGLARGYLNRPDLTAQKFIQNPFKADSYERLYKTGDLATRLPNGSLKFLGRIDHQIKVRGFRIELGEVESVLSEHPRIRQAVVLAKEIEAADQRLVAYIVLQPDTLATHQNLTIRQLRSWIKLKLPEHMIPSAFVLLEELPLTLNGKLDRRALPTPKWESADAGIYVEPRTALEAQLIDIWSEVLKVNQISIYDNFYELGGHSILAIQLIVQIKKALNLEVSLENLLCNPTVADFAGVIETEIKSELGSRFRQPEIEDRVLDPTIVPEQKIEGALPTVFLTGATGFLGAFLLRDLLLETRSDIYCLVRASSLPEGEMRIQINLERYMLWDENFRDRIKLVLGDLSEPLLGINPAQFERLSEKIDVIYHCGAWVNIAYPYSTLKETNVAGTQEVIRLASKLKVKPVHFVSTTDVFSSVGNEFIKTIFSNTAAGPLSKLCSGYAQSKFIAEQLVEAASRLGVPYSIYRPSNIIGDTENGICPTESFISMMLKGCLKTGYAPGMKAVLNLVPANYVSREIVRISKNTGARNQSNQIVNPAPVSWNQFVQALISSGYPIQQTSYKDWHRKLLDLATKEHNLLPLAGLTANENLAKQFLGALYFDNGSLSKDSSKTSETDHKIDKSFLNKNLKFILIGANSNALSSQYSLA